LFGGGGLRVGKVLSVRAHRFVQEVCGERRPHVEDLGLVRAAIEEAGLPVTEPVLDFHRTFAGYMTNVWGEPGPLGIIHPEVVAVESWFKPMKVGGYLTGDDIRLACVDVHMSHEMMIGLDGTFYSRRELSSSYFMWTEQSAFLWDFSMTHRWHRLMFAADNPEVSAVLARRLAGYRIDDLSDQYAQVYGTDWFAAGIGDSGQQCDVLVAEGKLLPEFADLILDQPPKH
jgi:hypothetical protein